MNSRIVDILRGWLALPTLWVLGGLVALIPNLVALPIVAADPAVEDAYYVVPHRLFMLSLAGSFALFAALYLALTVLLPRFRRVFGVIHFGLMAPGAVLVYAPSIFLTVGGLPHRSEDLRQSFTFWNTTQMAGDAMMLAGLGVFVAAILSGIWRRPKAATP